MQITICKKYRRVYSFLLFVASFDNTKTTSHRWRTPICVSHAAVSDGVPIINVNNVNTICQYQQTVPTHPAFISKTAHRVECVSRQTSRPQDIARRKMGNRVADKRHCASRIPNDNSHMNHVCGSDNLESDFMQDENSRELIFVLLVCFLAVVLWCSVWIVMAENNARRGTSLEYGAHPDDEADLQTRFFRFHKFIPTCVWKSGADGAAASPECGIARRPQWQIR